MALPALMSCSVRRLVSSTFHWQEAIAEVQRHKLHTSSARLYVPVPKESDIEAKTLVPQASCLSARLKVKEEILILAVL